MNAGRELDALVAEKVMGPEACGLNPGHKISDHLDHVPEFSTDIAAAWEVLEKISYGYITFSIEKVISSGICDRSLFIVKLRKSGGIHETVHVGRSRDSVSHAICLAALKAVSGA